MRVMPDRYAMPKPAKIKPQASEVAHVSAPLKGLNMSSKLTTGDPLTAPILTNFVVDDDRVTARAGYRKISTVTGGFPIAHLIPYYGAPSKLFAASNGRLALASTGAIIKSGFTSDDWHWTAYSNLGVDDYTLMVNGKDGVWSWDGSETWTDPAPVAVTNLSKTNPAVCTVAAGDIAKFTNGMLVTIAGAVGTGLINANGVQLIANVGSPANTFTLVGVDTSAAAGPQTSGVTAEPPGTGIVKEAVAAPPSAPWINPDNFNIVLNHMNRVWFADRANLAIYYLPLQQKSGEVQYLPLGALFKRGGTIRAMYTWTLEGGTGLNDHLVIFSSNGEAVIYQGVDPDSDFNLVGIFRFDSPMSKHSIVNFGGELYVLISTGLVPMSTMLKAESDQLGQVDKSVISLFLTEAVKYRDRSGWMTFLNPSSNRVFCNIPQGADNKYIQMIRHMPRPVWSQWQDIPAHCWGWIDPYVYFGDDSGHVYQMHPAFLSDDGNPIRVDVQMAWSQYKSPAIKSFKMVRTFVVADNAVRPFVDLKVDYNLSPPEMQPDVAVQTDGAVWDEATWDVDYWASGGAATTIWNGVGTLGRVGAPRLTAQLLGTTFSITGWDVLFERGAAI